MTETAKPESQYDQLNRQLREIESQLRQVTTLFHSVSLMGTFVVVHFNSAPAFRVQELTGSICDIVTETLKADYEILRWKDADLILQLSGHRYR